MLRLFPLARFEPPEMQHDGPRTPAPTPYTPPASPAASLPSLVVCVFSSLSLVPLTFSTFANLF